MSEQITRIETLAAGPAEGLAGLLGVALPDLAVDGLPALWHWVYLLDRPAQADLGPDGHPVRGVVPVPPGPGLRRMWAAGRVTTLGPLVVGREATRTSRVVASEAKRGRTGPMTFVTVRHEVRQADALVVQEDQQIVYREPPPAVTPEPGGLAPGPAPGPADLRAVADDWAIDTSATLLARFSALTYNGHRIHYDRDFARTVEGYPGLLVHGPLQAVAMAEAARRDGGGRVHPLSFEYRLVAPLFDHQGMVVRARRTGPSEVQTEVLDSAARRTAVGTLTWVDLG